MTSQKSILKLRLINTGIFALLLCIQYSGIFNIKIMNANPLISLALLVAICMFCSELTAALSGVILGVFMDTVTATPPAFNAIVLLVIGLAVALIVRHLFNNNIFSAIALCAMCSTAYYILRWLLEFAFLSSLSENLIYLLQTALPSIIYTSIFIVPFYFLEKKLYKKFYK